MTRRVAASAVLLIVLTACSSAPLTKAETAYLADLERSNISTKQEDAEAALKDGHEICDSFAKVKPAERSNLAFYARTHMANGRHVASAQSFLCPELFR